MMSVGHVLDHVPDHVLDYMIIGLVTMTLQEFQSADHKYLAAQSIESLFSNHLHKPIIFF